MTDAPTHVVPGGVALAPRAGLALVLGDDINTDELHPSRFYSLQDATVRSGFLQAVPGRRGETVDVGRILVAGQHFGLGSSRETGARVFILNGVRAIVATGFARIFLRNIINLGLPAFVCTDPALREAVRDGSALIVDPQALTLTLADGRVLALEAPDALHARVLEAGGLVPYLGLHPGAAPFPGAPQPTAPAPEAP